MSLISNAPRMSVPDPVHGQGHLRSQHCQLQGARGSDPRGFMWRPYIWHGVKTVDGQVTPLLCSNSGCSQLFSLPVGGRCPEPGVWCSSLSVFTARCQSQDSQPCTELQTLPLNTKAQPSNCFLQMETAVGWLMVTSKIRLSVTSPPNLSHPSPHSINGMFILPSA